MKKVAGIFVLVMLLFVACVSANAKEWYEGGNLHNSTVAQWKKASQANKLATCGDWLANFWMKSKLDLTIYSMDDLKKYASMLVDYIDTATKSTRDLDKQPVNGVALFGMIAAGWVQPESSSNSGGAVLIDPNESDEDIDEKLKANGFLLSEEIEEIWKNEQTPDVLDKLTTAQQKAIVEELRKAQDEAAKSSLDFGKGIKNASDRAEYQEGVRKNKVLKATRAIAKKYGIQAGDIFVVEFNVTASKL
mgnify:CR=1 FL=1